MSTPLSAEQLKKIALDKAMAESAKAMEEMQKAEREKQHLREAFMTREIPPDAMDRLMMVVQRLAAQGKTEVMILHFPSSYLPDGGRAINSFEKDWPDSLDGFAKRAFDYYQEHLKPHGYKLRAQVIDFPGGQPGDIGFFLIW